MMKRSRIYKLLGMLLQWICPSERTPTIRERVYRIIYQTRKHFAPPPSHERCGDCPYEKGCKYEMCALSIIYEREKEARLKGDNDGKGKEDQEAKGKALSGTTKVPGNGI